MNLPAMHVARTRQVLVRTNNQVVIKLLDSHTETFGEFFEGFVL